MLSCFSYVWLFATPWTVAHQASLSMEFSSQEYWNELPFPSPEKGRSSKPSLKEDKGLDWGMRFKLWSQFISAKLLQLCPTLCDSMDCSPPGSSVHGILQARILDGVACHALLQGVFPTQGSNLQYAPFLPRAQQQRYRGRYLGGPKMKDFRMHVVGWQGEEYAGDSGKRWQIRCS